MFASASPHQSSCVSIGDSLRIGVFGKKKLGPFTRFQPQSSSDGSSLSSLEQMVLQKMAQTMSPIPPARLESCASLVKI